MAHKQDRAWCLFAFSVTPCDPLPSPKQRPNAHDDALCKRKSRAALGRRSQGTSPIDGREGLVLDHRCIGRKAVGWCWHTDRIRVHTRGVTLCSLLSDLQPRTCMVKAA